jgi:uncharacterized protein YbaR (Trm112 family)
MKKCKNHPEVEALSICHVCGNDYCDLCLDEGKEYYFCKKAECHKLFEDESEKFETPQDVVCPNCSCELELSNEERRKGKIRCPECELAIDFASNPPKIIEDENYQEILQTLNQGDISVIKSILEDGNIDYFTLGENFLGVRPLLEPVRLFVNEDQIEQAKELLQDFELKIFGFSTRQDEDL